MKNKIVTAIMSIVIVILSIFTILYFVGGNNESSGDKTLKIKKNDIVVIDFKGKIDNKAFKGGEAKNYQLKIGSKSFIDNFEDQLIGHKINDVINVKVKFPKNYFEKKYAGKNAVFETKINGIYSYNGNE